MRSLKELEEKKWVRKKPKMCKYHSFFCVASIKEIDRDWEGN